MIDKLTFLERVDPGLLVLGVLLVLLPAAALALVVAWRTRDDKKAGARVLAARPARVPRHMQRRVWDFDDRGRTW